MTNIKTTFHFTHKSIGKATHAKQAASANVFYITRDGELFQAREGAEPDAFGVQVAGGMSPSPEASTKKATDEAVSYNSRDSAASVVLAGRMPEDRTDAARFLDQRAAADRANGRVADTFIMSLPRELSREQNAELVRDWCETVTKGKAAYFAAIHDKGKDAANPHAHVIIRDRDYSKDYEREKDRPRVIGTSTGRKEISEAQRRGVEPPPIASTKDLRMSWADTTNKHLEKAGLELRVDPRSYKERGLEQQAGIHVGRAGPRMAAKGLPIASRDVDHGTRLMPYSVTDQGTRAEHNASIKAANERRELMRAEMKATREIAGGPKKDDKPEAAVPMTREEKEKAQLAIDHAKDRAGMFSEQRQDTSTLRAVHAAELATHKTWARDVMGQCGEKVAAAMSSAYAAKWAGTESMADGPAKAAAVAALRAEQAAEQRAALASAKAEAKAQKLNRAAELKARHKLERDALKGAHKDEQRLAYKEHRAEREAVHGKWDVVHAKQTTGRVEARLSGSQAMPSIQGAASQMAIMRNRAAQAAARPMHPDQHQRVAEQRGRDALAAKSERAAVRGSLYAGREVSERRLGAAARGELHAGREMTERRQREEQRQDREEVTDSRAARVGQVGKGESPTKGRGRGASDR